jgi:hypothetical protein
VRYWRELRAGLITLAIGLGLLDGCPLPRNGKERTIARQRLGAGLADTVAELEATRTWLLEPVRPAAELFGLRQRWKLFSGAARRRYRMAIESRAGDGPWRLWYRPHDDDHAFRADAIAYRRVRGAWNPHSTFGARGGYSVFAAWIADEVFAADPDATEVRVVMEKILIGPHGDYYATGEQAYPLSFKRQARELAHLPRGRR